MSILVLTMALITDTDFTIVFCINISPSIWPDLDIGADDDIGIAMGTGSDICIEMGMAWHWERH